MRDLLDGRIALNPAPYVTAYHPSPPGTPHSELMNVYGRLVPQPPGYYVVSQRGCIVDIDGPFASEAEAHASMPEPGTRPASGRERSRARARWPSGGDEAT